MNRHFSAGTQQSSVGKDLVFTQRTRRRRWIDDECTSQLLQRDCIETDPHGAVSENEIDEHGDATMQVRIFRYADVFNPGNRHAFHAKHPSYAASEDDASGTGSLRIAWRHAMKRQRGHVIARAGWLYIAIAAVALAAIARVVPQ